MVNNVFLDAPGLEFGVIHPKVVSVPIKNIGTAINVSNVGRLRSGTLLKINVLVLLMRIGMVIFV